MDASTVFTALSLLVMLRKPLQMFPRVLTTTLDGWVAVKRSENFLSLPEIQRTTFSKASPDQVGISVNHASARWATAVKVEDKKKKNKSPAASPRSPKSPKRELSGEDNGKGKGKGEGKGEGEGEGKAGADSDSAETSESYVMLSDISLNLGPGTANANANANANADNNNGTGTESQQETGKQSANLFGVVVGGVGSGKSSLLQMLLGGMRSVHADVDGTGNSSNIPTSGASSDGNTVQTDGDPNPPVRINGDVACVPQVPYILNETVRQNILFGRTLNPEW